MGCGRGVAKSDNQSGSRGRRARCRKDCILQDANQEESLVAAKPGLDRWLG